MSDEKAESRTAIYLNKRAVSRIDIPVPHAMSAYSDGWRIEFGAPGRLRLLMSEGHNDNLDVAAGDYLLSSGEDFYLSLQAEPSRQDKDRIEKEERSRGKAEHRGKGPGHGKESA